MKYTLLIFSLLISTYVHASGDNKDWRKDAADDVKLKNLIKVMPSTSDIMFQIGERYKNFYWAAKQEKWKFAEYQMEEMQKLIQALMITRPKRKADAETFMQTAFVDFADAIEEKDWNRFSKAFADMRGACIQCHIKNDHEFIVPAKAPSKGSSPALD